MSGGSFGVASSAELVMLRTWARLWPAYAKNHHEAAFACADDVASRCGTERARVLGLVHDFPATLNALRRPSDG